MQISKVKGETIMNCPLFETKNLCFNQAVTYNNLSIPMDKVTFITGASGCGKTTFLRLLNATLSPVCGDVYYLGRNIASLDTLTLRKEVSLISQNVFLFDVSIKENFRLFYEYRNQKPPADAEIIKMLTLCCLDFPVDKDCTTMSGGERQRVYMAVFLSFLPRVLLLDEPTSALDNKNSHEMLENIIGYCKRNSISLIIVSHDQALTEKFSENTVLMERCV